MDKVESWSELDEVDRERVLGVLEHRFGDGTVYLCGPEDRVGHALGCLMGLIDPDGLITNAGRRLVASVQA